MAAAAFLLAGCGARRLEHTQTVVRDSAEIAIVEITPGTDEVTWSIERTPLLDLSGNDGDPQGAFYQVAGAVRLSDGRIAVANAGAEQIRMFARDGHPLDTLGRDGSGPGEFRFLSWLGLLRGDSIAAWDAQLSRLTVFAPTGRVARVVEPTRPLGLLPFAHAVLGDGAIVLAVRDGVAALPRGGVTRDTPAIVALSVTGARADTIGRFPGAEQYVTASAGGMIAHPLAFGWRTLATAAHADVFVPSGNGYELRVFRVPGRLQRIIRVKKPPVRVTDADIRAYRQALVTQGIEGNPGMQARMRQILHEMPYPRRMAPITDLKTDPAGNLWVEEAESLDGNPAKPWRVIDPDGKQLATVRTPATLRVTQIGDRWVLGIAVDEQQVERVRLYRLDRR